MPLRGPLKNCCCFSVETGTIILGVIDLLAALSSLVTCSVTLSNLNSNEDELRQNIESVYTNLYRENSHEGVTDDIRKGSKELSSVIVSAVRSFSISGIVNGCLMIVIISILFLGIFKRRAILLLPYMVIKGLNVIFVGLLSLVFVIILLAGIGTIPFAVWFFGIIIILGLFCLFVYMWIVVYSHYVVLKEENARGQYDKQAYRAT